LAGAKIREEVTFVRFVTGTPRLTAACTRPRIARPSSARRRACSVECAAGDAGRYALLPMNRTRILGAYVVVAGLLHAVLYLLLSTSRNHDWLFYFDPRIGTFFLETGWRGAEQIVPGVVRWLTVGWLVMIGVLLFTGRTLIQAYIISEIILSLPNIFFFVVIVLANLSPAHWFSVGECSFPFS
jgi:hypothetical protein